MAKATLSKTEKKKQNIAIAVLVLLCAPILYLYISFFSLAFLGADGAFTLSNFDFLYLSLIHICLCEQILAYLKTALDQIGDG